ncbi:hypothetical protein [Pseudofulvimonas gallinarii]|uniref:hypothetical protein n=1 Tax=Pseudofulvimonas gallinarii TaxID=634155 RepID=UPI000F47C29D|nr:hypothetical protein [Pseudofulvimonas gallinarii]
MNPARSRVLPLILGLALSAGSASAATIVVAAGETGIAANGHCSLIEAMENAQTDSRVHADCVAGSGADVIRLSPGDYVLAQPLSPGSNTALPHISTPMTIQGNGSTLRRSAHPSTPPFRFMTMSAASLTLEGLTFRNARLQTTYYFDGGAVISQSGGSLLARDVRFIDNGASSNGRGGAVFIANASGGIGAHAVFEDCLFEGNFTDTLPGQHGSGGGAIWIEGGDWRSSAAPSSTTVRNRSMCRRPAMVVPCTSATWAPRRVMCPMDSSARCGCATARSAAIAPTPPAALACRSARGSSCHWAWSR